MKFRHIISSLRTYGLIGCYNWLARLVVGDSNAKRLAKTRIQNPNYVPIKGITLIGDFNPSKSSLSKVMSDFANFLRTINIPVQTCNLADQIPNSFAINKFSDIIGMVAIPPTPTCPRCRRHRIVFWEFDTGFLSQFPSFYDGDPVIVFSNFCRDSLRKQIPPDISIRKLLYPFSFKAPNMPPAKEIRQQFGIDEHDFTVFFNFDYHSGYSRKNPDATMEAFARAFANTPNAKLVFKTMRANKHPDLVQKLLAKADALGISRQLITINDYLAQDLLIGLTNACDVYISLHRGEGFGLGIAEAMSLGKPVVVSDYSAPQEFCNPNNCMPIPCETVKPLPIQLDSPNYMYVKRWAQPDINAAADALRKLYDDPAFRQDLGAKAKRFIEEYFSLENFKASVDEFLDN